MLTISNQIRDLNPDSWYNFKPNDVMVQFDNKQRYGVNEEVSYFINAVNADYMIPRWNRPTANFYAVDTNIQSNQLADSEFLMENDGSIMVGRNNTRMAGLYAHEALGEVETIDDVLAKINNNTIHEYLFQIRGSSNALKPNNLVFEYGKDNDECYVPIVYDSKLVDKSFAIGGRYQLKNGNQEIWSIVRNPEFIENDGFGNIQDTRDITFKLVNPSTGRSIGKSFTYEYVRSGSLTPVNSKAVSWIADPGRMYEQQFFDPSDDPREIGIEAVYIMKNSAVAKMLTNDNMKLAIPSWQEIYVLVNVPRQNDNGRSYDLTDQTSSVTTDSCVLNTLGLKFNYHSINRTMTLFDTELNQKVNTVSFSVPADQTILVYIRANYQTHERHNPTAGIFHYSMVFEFTFPNVNMTQKYYHTRLYDGGMKEFMYKGLQKVTSIRSFDSYPFMIGNMVELDQNVTSTRTIKCKFSPSEPLRDIVVPARVPYTSTSVICAFDNYAKFVNKQIYHDLEKVYEAQNYNDNVGPARSLVQYWPCDSLRSENLRSTRNTKNFGTGATGYDLYGYMNLMGTGKVEVQQVMHNTVRSGLYFDGNVTGNSNNMTSWSNNGYYSLNFWIKTEQKTKGTLLCDMEHEDIITSGVYIGIAEGGGLEIAIGATTSRIFPVNVSDNEWHMISISVQGTFFNVFFDARLISRYEVYQAKLNKDYTKNYQVYFMGHPRGKNVKGTISRIGFYASTMFTNHFLEMFQGDVEHRIYGTVLASNMPYETDVRFFNFRTGEYISTARSSRDTGRFVYRNYEGVAVHLMVVNNNRKYGLIQVMGPLNPASVPL